MVIGMFDPLSGRYRFSCPARGEHEVCLSSFRSIRQLPGAEHPAVYAITFACPCGEEHPGLVSHDDLDWAPICGHLGSFFNPLTARMEEAHEEALLLAATKIRSGSWPWSFYCYAENRIRPAVPSSFIALTPGEHHYGLMVRCASCQTASVNLVSQPHLDVPFYNDAKVAVIEHVFADDAEQLVEQFAASLFSAEFDRYWQTLDF